jgi:hypothetical protein
MRRKALDTWWGAVVVGVVAGGVAGAIYALLSDIGSSWSLAHHAFVAIPAGMAGGVVFYLLLHAHNMRRDRQAG